MPTFCHPSLPAAPKLFAQRGAHSTTLRMTLLAWFATAFVAAPGLAVADSHAVLDRAAANAIVDAPDRSVEDRGRDARRRPDELLEFAQIGPGMTAVDLGAGDGYTTELLARAVGPTGKVYAQNSALVIEKYVKESWPARLAKPINANVVRVDAEFADPLPRSTKDVDVITMIFIYHDTYRSKLGDFDHKLFLRRLYKAMTPEGRIIVVDHRAKEGARGAEVADEQHRIDEARVKRDFEQAGFVLDSTADFMSNADDPRTQAFFEMEQPTDAFVHRWVKPKD